MENNGAFEAGLWARGLAKAYAGTRVLEGLDLDVAPGEVVGLLGPNGAGKSTALRIMCGLTQPDAGSTRVAGVEVAQDAEGARGKLGFLAQDTLLYARHTVLETMRLFAGLQGLAGAQQAAAVDRWMERLKLGPLAGRLVGTLSSGERQRANLARALVHDPPVAILDEPTTALDPETVDLLLRVMGELKAEKRAILLCTHALADAELIVDRAVFLHAGKKVAEGTLASILEETGAKTLTGAFLAIVRAKSPEGVNAPV